MSYSHTVSEQAGMHYQCEVFVHRLSAGFSGPAGSTPTGQKINEYIFPVKNFMLNFFPFTSGKVYSNADLPFSLSRFFKSNCFSFVHSPETAAHEYIIGGKFNLRQVRIENAGTFQESSGDVAVLFRMHSLFAFMDIVFTALSP